MDYSSGIQIGIRKVWSVDHKWAMFFIQVVHNESFVEELYAGEGWGAQQLFHHSWIQRNAWKVGGKNEVAERGGSCILRGIKSQLAA